MRILIFNSVNTNWFLIHVFTQYPSIFCLCGSLMMFSDGTWSTSNSRPHFSTFLHLRALCWWACGSCRPPWRQWRGRKTPRLRQKGTCWRKEWKRPSWSTSDLCWVSSCLQTRWKRATPQLLPQPPPKPQMMYTHVNNFYTERATNGWLFEFENRILITHFCEFHRFRDSIFYCQMTITGKHILYNCAFPFKFHMLNWYSFNHILYNIREDTHRHCKPMISIVFWILVNTPYNEN